MNIFYLANIVCGIIIFAASACRLGAKQWGRWSLEMWANVLLLPSAVTILVESRPSLHTLMFRVGVAAYFVVQALRIWRIQHTRRL